MNPCGDCKKTACECPWLHDGTPVEGWVAEPTIIQGRGYKIDSFNIKKCPLFVKQKDNSKEKSKMGNNKPIRIGFVDDDGVEHEFNSINEVTDYLIESGIAYSGNRGSVWHYVQRTKDLHEGGVFMMYKRMFYLLDYKENDDE